jgi:hypothetical protein
MDPDANPDPAIFIIDLQNANKNLIKNYFLKVHLHDFSKIKSQKKDVTNLEIKVFLTIFDFCLMIEITGSGSRKPKTCGSVGSGFGSGSATLLNKHAF